MKRVKISDPYFACSVPEYTTTLHKSLSFSNGFLRFAVFILYGRLGKQCLQ